MSTTRLLWHEGFRFTGTDSYGRDVAIDADLAANNGAKPSDLLPIALAACTAYDIVNILQKQRQGLRALETTIESEQGSDPPFAFERITVRYLLRGEIAPVKARKALELSEQQYC